VNSNNPSAAMLGNGGAVVNASSINVVGGVSWQGTISPTSFTGVTPFPDPLRTWRHFEYDAFAWYLLRRRQFPEMPFSMIIGKRPCGF
jgi:hypothetical protein